MKTALLSLLTLLFTLGMLAACAPAAANPTRISAQDAGKTIELKTGDILIVSLEGNMTTGYSWVPAPQDPVLLKQVGDVQVTPSSDLIGAPGLLATQFQAVATGQTTLRLEYKRPWEENVLPEKTFEVTLVIR